MIHVLLSWFEGNIIQHLSFFLSYEEGRYFVLGGSRYLSTLHIRTPASNVWLALAVLRPFNLVGSLVLHSCIASDRATLSGLPGLWRGCLSCNQSIETMFSKAGLCSLMTVPAFSQPTPILLIESAWCCICC